MRIDLKNKRVTVMGLGRFGGGVGVARFLCGRGAKVLVTDRATHEDLADSVAGLEGLDVTFRLGEHRTEDFTDTDLVVVNPAVDARRNEYLAAAMAAGVTLTSEIRLLIENLPRRERTIGITGSAGKSTTTAMIGVILRDAFGEDRVHVGGNIGGSLLDRIDRIGEDDWVVLELSSFMLEGMAGDGWSPHIAAVTNLTPNHLDRHGTMADYAAAKQVILEYQRLDDYAILGGNCAAHLLPRTARVTWLDGMDTYINTPPLDLLIPGEHNITNARLAIEACAAAGVARHQAAAALRSFTGLPHRLQLVAEHAGVRYFNDSKATTPDATMLAIDSFAPATVHIILGGYDKGSDLTAMARLAAKRCKGIYTLGATGPAIAAAAEAAADKTASVTECGDLDAAMERIAANVQSGDVVLLSTGCASWGQFDNYEERGKAFCQAVGKHTGEGVNRGAS